VTLKFTEHGTDPGAVPGDSTISTGMRLMVCRDSCKNGLRAEDDDIGSNPLLCAFDGVEIGSMYELGRMESPGCKRRYRERQN
jgi:hypothetical protein